LAAATTLDDMMWGCVEIKEMVGHQPLTGIVNKAGGGHGTWWEDRGPLGGGQSNQTHLKKTKVAFFTLVLFQRQKRTCFKNFSVWPLLQKQVPFLSEIEMMV